MDKGIWIALQPMLSQGARDVLRTVGAGLLAHGYITDGAGVQAFIGAGMTLAGLFWGWWTTSGYLQAGALLKKLTATHTAAAAVEVAKVMPAASQTGAADSAKAIVTASGVVKVLIAAFALSLFLPHSSFAQVRRPLAVTGDPIKDIKTDLNNAGIKVPTTKAGATCDFNIFAALNPQNVVTDVQNCVSDVNKLFLPDVQAALDSATAYSDKPAIDCLTPALAIVKAAVGTPAVIAPDGTITTPAVQAGIILIFQKFREFTLANGPSACKNWVQSTINGTVSNAL